MNEKSKKHISLNPGITVRKSHEIATRAERRLNGKIINLASVVVHVELARGNNFDKKR